MEMLAIFFAISDNLKAFKKIKRTRQIVIIRSDSRSTVEQLNNRAQINDKIIQRIYESIKRMLQKICFIIVFDHLNRTKNRAGRLLEKVFRNNTRYLNKKHNIKKIERQYLYIQYTESNLKYENIFTNPTKPILMH
jgi:3-phosphoglycerate kinase